jgi:hypothetical protein
MNATEMKAMKNDLNDLLEQVGTILHDRHLVVVHMVLARLFVGVSMESNATKEAYMQLCSDMWDNMIEAIAEETKH